MRTSFLLVCVAVLAACSKRVPASHRVSADPCPVERPASNAGEHKWSPECSLDTDCGGVNPRCVPNPFAWEWKAPKYICSGDACFTDEDCGGGRACLCRDSESSGANICIGPGNCHADSDCGQDGFCSLSRRECGEGFGWEGFFCHTPKDECLGDADCSPPDVGIGKPHCYFNANNTRWECSTLFCAY